MAGGGVGRADIELKPALESLNANISVHFFPVVLFSQGEQDVLVFNNSQTRC